MMAEATTATTTNSASLIKMARCRRMLGALIEVVGDDQRVAGGGRAGQLPDGAAPLQLQLGEGAVPAGAGEQRCVDSAQRELDDRGQVGVVAAEPFAQGFVGPRIGGQQTQRTGEVRSGVGK